MVCSHTKKLALFLAPLLVTACGGGSESASPDVNAGADPGRFTAATVVLEERSGKTAVDAWFEQSLNHSPLTTAFANTANRDSCEPAPIPTRGAHPSLVREDTQIDIVNRSGPIVSLVPNQLSSATVYTTDSRWLSTPVSDDASLVFTSSPQFQSVGIVSLPTLEPLLWVSPRGGVLNNVNDTLQWMPSLNQNTAVKINVSVTNPNSAGANNMSIVCYAIDDGSFQLDSQTQQRLTAINGDGRTGGTVVIRAQRLRAQSFSSADAQLAVVQISHERPASR